VPAHRAVDRAATGRVVRARRLFRQPGDLLRQAEVYRGIVRACLQSPGCTAIQTWGFTDKYSWIGSHSHRTRGAALPFDRSYKPKPAYDAILEEISRKP
jgi:endo-1,4-beta-xylanase